MCTWHDNINELSKNKYGKLGSGFYCTPILRYAEGYGKANKFGGKNYNFIFMCRVNPSIDIKLLYLKIIIKMILIEWIIFLNILFIIIFFYFIYLYYNNYK